MRTKGGLEDVKCLDFSSHCGDQCSFLFLFGRHLGINTGSERCLSRKQVELAFNFWQIFLQ
jgi:hypothetical protein